MAKLMIIEETARAVEIFVSALFLRQIVVLTLSMLFILSLTLFKILSNAKETFF